MILNFAQTGNSLAFPNRGQSAQQLADAFETRVLADGGIYEAEPCLVSRIQTLKNLGLWDKASAVWLPHGVKANKFYAVKGGSGADLGFTRAGTRTRKAATYLETVATGLPALDYTGSTCPSLSLEPAKTNLLLQSEAFDNASWSIKNQVTVAANTTAGPENLSTADALLETVTPTVEHYIGQGITKDASALDYTFSIFIKPNGRNWARIQITSGTGNGHLHWFDVLNGVKGSLVNAGTGTVFKEATITPAANGFYRCTITITTNTETEFICFVVIGTADMTSSYTGDVTKGLYIYGAQLEQASYATSHIKTEAATVSRVADAIPALTGVSNLIGQTEGTLYFEGSAPNTGTHKVMGISDNTANNEVVLNFSATNTINCLAITGGVTQANIVGPAYTPGTNTRAAITYRGNKIALFVDGSKIAEDLTATIPAMNQFMLSENGINIFYGNGKAWAISKTAISDAEAITWTT